MNPACKHDNTKGVSCGCVVCKDCGKIIMPHLHRVFSQDAFTEREIELRDMVHNAPNPSVPIGRLDELIILRGLQREWNNNVWQTRK